MNTTIKGALVASLAVLGLSLAACQNKQEEAADKTADAVQMSSDAAADAMDASAASMSGAPADAMNDQADAVRASGNTEAKAIKDSAEKAN